MKDLDEVMQFLFRCEGTLRFHREPFGTTIRMSARNATVQRVVADAELEHSKGDVVKLQVIHAATMLDREIGS